MKIGIGSTNEAKNTAVKNVFSKLGEFTYESVEVDSGIKKQPRSSNEAIKGALKRAEEALKKTRADYGIGLEGTVDTNEHGMFLIGWVVIIDRQGIESVGGSGAVKVPEEIRTRIENGEELGEVIKEIYNDSENTIRQGEGATGIFTRGLYPRTKEFQDAILCALGNLLKKKKEL